ncbi:protein FAM, partial [Clarias magur]
IMFEVQSAVLEVNRLCVPIMVYHVDERESGMAVKQKCKRLQELSRAPITCLVGTIESLNEEVSHLPLLHRHRNRVQVRSDNTKGHLESTNNEKREKPHSKPWLISCNMDTEKMNDIPKMVELYKVPQFSDFQVPLPHNTSYWAIVARVIQAQRHLMHKPSLKAIFRNILSSTTVERFVINSFWWLFLENFQPNRNAQDRLFGQIAENYISILTQSLSSNSGTLFLQDFPSTLSQMLFCCFSYCFPQSCCFRDPAFLTALCSTAYQWTGVENAASQSTPVSDLKALSDHRKPLAREKSARESHAVGGQTMEVKQCVFNVWGNSPLVQHFMNTLCLQRDVGYNVLCILIYLNSLTADPLTYRGILKQTHQRSSCQRRELRSLWAQHAQEISIMQHKREDEQNQLLRKHKKILSQRSVVHRLCQLLVPPPK